MLTMTAAKLPLLSKSQYGSRTSLGDCLEGRNIVDRIGVHKRLWASVGGNQRWNTHASDEQKEIA